MWNTGSQTNNEFKNLMKHHELFSTIQRAECALKRQRSQLMMTDRLDSCPVTSANRYLQVRTSKLTSFIHIIYWELVRYKWINSTVYSTIFVNHINAYYVDRRARQTQSARNSDYLKNNSFSANARNRVCSQGKIRQFVVLGSVLRCLHRSSVVLYRIWDHAVLIPVMQFLITPH